MSKNDPRIWKVIASYLRMEEPTDETGATKWLLGETPSSEEIEGIWLESAGPLKMTKDAYGFLTRLKELDLIDDDLQEEIIEMAMLSSMDEIGIEDVKGIAAMLIFDKAPDTKRERVYH